MTERNKTITFSLAKIFFLALTRGPPGVHGAMVEKTCLKLYTYLIALIFIRANGEQSFMYHWTTVHWTTVLEVVGSSPALVQQRIKFLGLLSLPAGVGL